MNLLININVIRKIKKNRTKLSPPPTIKPQPTIKLPHT